MRKSFFVQNAKKQNKTNAFVMILFPEFAKHYKTNVFVMIFAILGNTIFWINDPIQGISTMNQYNEPIQ